MAKKQVTFWKATDGREIAEQLIAAFHQHLAGETILYVFRSEHSEKKGKIVLGTARKVSGLNAYLAFRERLDGDQDLFGGRGDHSDEPPEESISAFYVMEIAHDMWIKLTGPQRIALVDHELSHFGPDGIVGHDVEEFRDVIARHGLWKPDLKAFGEAMKQQPLFEAVSDLRPKRGSGVSAVTITAAGETITFRQDDVH